MAEEPRHRTNSVTIELGLRKRRIARRIKLAALLATGILFAAGVLGAWQSDIQWLWFAPFLAALIIHIGAGMYMGVAKCPRCHQRFSRRTLLGFISSLEDQFTLECQSCGLALKSSRAP